jgi:hypothetical protein
MSEYLDIFIIQFLILYRHVAIYRLITDSIVREYEVQTIVPNVQFSNAVGRQCFYRR